MLRTYVVIKSYVFFYLECDFFIFVSHLGIVKVRNIKLMNLYIERSIIKSFVISYQVSRLLSYIFLLISKGYKNQFKLIGVGYRQFYSNNMVVYKLRYSHLIYNILPIDILSFKKNKKKKFFSLYGLNKERINTMINL